MLDFTHKKKIKFFHKLYKIKKKCHSKASKENFFWLHVKINLEAREKICPGLRKTSLPLKLTISYIKYYIT